MLTKRKALAIILIVVVVIALSIGTWFVSEVQYLIKNVKITEIEWESGFNPYSGGTLENAVKVTVQNSGAEDVGGLTLAVKMVYNGIQLEYSKGFTEQIEMLHAGESLKIRGWVLSFISNRQNPTECVSTLMWGDVTLDKQTKVIEWN